MASGSITRLPENMSDNGQAETVKQYSVQLGLLSWELDLFGRVRSLEAGALEQYLATEQARVATRTALIAAVADAWLSTAADAETLALSRETLDAYRTSADLIRQSREAGVASDLDLAQASSQVEAARAAVAAFSGRLAADRDALDLLAGTAVAGELLPDALTSVTDLRDLSAGVPSEVLLRRPDILAAEHQLRAANADIGAARAAFFPSISLTAGAGTMSRDLSGLFKSGSGTWTFVPQIVAPLFASGSLKANLRATELDRSIAVARYEKAIQAAFAEVSDALALGTTLASSGTRKRRCSATSSTPCTSPRPATRPGSTATSRCWSPSAPCSRRGRAWSPCAWPSRSTWSPCTRRSAEASSRPSHRRRRRPGGREEQPHSPQRSAVATPLVLPGSEPRGHVVLGAEASS